MISWKFSGRCGSMPGSQQPVVLVQMADIDKVGG
jgi:hypothetical protein